MDPQYRKDFYSSLYCFPLLLSAQLGSVKKTEMMF